jgi:hypothetical protein
VDEQHDGALAPGAPEVGAPVPGAAPGSAGPVSGAPVSATPSDGGPVLEAPPIARGPLALGAPVVAPSRWTGRRIALLIGGIIGGAVAFSTAVSLLAIFVVVPMWRASSPEWLVNNAASRLDAAAVVHVRGSFLDRVGRRVELDARVGEDRLVGTQHIDGQRAEFRSAQNSDYVKGSSGYWNIVDPSMAGVYANTWVRGWDDGIRLQLDPFAEPKTLARTLRKEFAGQAYDGD